MKKKILLIRFRRVGDALLTTAVINSLKKTVPNSEIHYVLNSGMSDVFENHPHIDKIIGFSKEDLSSFPRYVKKIWKLMNSEKYDIIVDPRSTIMSSLFSLFSLKTKYRIGQIKPHNRFIHNYRENIFAKVNYIEQQLCLLDPLSKEYEVVKDTNFDTTILSSDIQQFRQYMETEGVDFGRPVLVCTVAARVDTKRWRMDRMKEVISRIIDKYKDIQIIFNYGDKVEEELANSVYKDMGCPKQIFMNVAANSLTELAAMLANSDYLFGNEGGPRHLSQSLGIASYAIYSPGNSIHNWLPNRSDRYDGISSEELLEPEAVAQLSHQERFDSITVDRVWAALAPKLEKYLYQKKEVGE